jgi:hypothetical protein
MEPFVKTEQAGLPTVFLLQNWMTRFEGLKTGFSSRHGGVSAGNFESLNCGLHVHDLPERVVENRSRLARASGLPFDAWTFMEQVHDRRVAVVTAKERGSGRDSRESALQATDALITNEPGICLCAQFADCVPLFFLDPRKRAVGLAHAGWKGTVLQIARATVKAMQEEYGSHPEDLLAAIGPSIGLCCYEIDDKVMNPVKELMRAEGIRPDACGGQPLYIEHDEGKYRLNLQQLNRQIMIKAGILPTNIELTKWCTGCHTDWFYSHRKEGGRTGRMAAWIGWAD